MLFRFFLIFSFVFLISCSSYLQAKEYTKEEIENFIEKAKSGSWATDNKDILKVQTTNRWSVAHYLAEYNPNWSTNDTDILELQDNKGKTVEDILKERSY